MTAHFLSINQTRSGPIRGVGSSYIRAWARKWTCQRGCEIVPPPRHSWLRSFISKDVFVYGAQRERRRAIASENFQGVVAREEKLSLSILTQVSIRYHLNVGLHPLPAAPWVPAFSHPLLIDRSVAADSYQTVSKVPSCIKSRP